MIKIGQNLDRPNGAKITPKKSLTLGRIARLQSLHCAQSLAGGCPAKEKLWLKSEGDPERTGIVGCPLTTLLAAKQQVLY